MVAVDGKHSCVYEIVPALGRRLEVDFVEYQEKLHRRNQVASFHSTAPHLRRARVRLEYLEGLLAVYACAVDVG